MFVDMFVDDGGIPTTKFVDMPCNQNSVNQVFKDNIKTGEIESVNKPGATKFMMGSCDNNRPSQQFEVLSCAVMLEVKKKTGPTPYDMLTIGDRRSTDPGPASVLKSLVFLH
ncbi:hypothetical protein PF005_g18918 [Phytophthora fragariae]|uniref:Uncharacterized protein n=1 Tax=Phytophthora fragariae TaxID=53985 RepID=A0A6A3WV24_9STRA|nr:hypothetical protein PF005_g18918 [Phytophthora fragariae]